ncbi:MAG: PIN domain-containing protein [Planctomycetales bacterium]
MNAVDTNVLIYRFDRDEHVKQAKARELLRQISSGPTQTILLGQVLGVLMRQLRYWQDRGDLTQAAVVRYVGAVRNLFPIALPTEQVADYSLELAARYSLSHWDSMFDWKLLKDH